MKEININIEGYNVNGICVGCLNYNRKMYYSTDIVQCFKILADIDVPDGLSIQICWECLAAVKAVLRFKRQITNCYEILLDYSKENTFLNDPKDLSLHATTRLETRNLLKQEEIESVVSVQEISEENAVGNMKTEPEFPFPVEFDDNVTIKSEIDLGDDPYPDDVPADRVSSDDDIQLSKLKRKKERKGKKMKKRKKEKSPTTVDQKSIIDKKLKNLPDYLVELCTLTEQEMWEIRREDVECKEFIKMKYKCELCLLSFNTEKIMSDHVHGKHTSKGDTCQQCDICKAYLLTKESMTPHRKSHLLAYRCKECKYRTTMKRLILKHINVHEVKIESEFECPICKSLFSTKSKLAYHRAVCSQEKPQCDCCGKVFANKMTLKYHLKLTPAGKEEKPKEKLYIPCKGCNKVFPSKKSLRAHAVIHKGLTYPCPICGKLFQWKRNLARHTRNHRDREAGAQHECRECKKTFSSRDCYNNHMKLSKKHVDEDTYLHECNYCGKRFPSKWCMVDHIDWDHLKLIKYQCNVCFKSFKTSKILIAHVNNLHEGKKKLEPEQEHLCEICGKSYKTAKRLRGHVWAMHKNRSNTKSFKCSMCPATFTWQTSIYKHVKMMHANKRPKPARIPQQAPNMKIEPYPGLDPSRVSFY